MSRTFSIGWDVGAWGSKKGDALWMLDGSGKTYGNPNHGNWGSDIQEARTAEEFIQNLFGRCDGPLPPDTSLVTLAIDAPLTFPAGFMKLLAGECVAEEPLGKAINNPYLFRRTEAFASEQRERKRNPLSPLQDQIGSQATKIAHVLTKFGLRNDGAGVWRARSAGGLDIQVLEAYPAMCKQSKAEDLLPGRLQHLYDQALVKHAQMLPKHRPVTQDEKDALICALTAHLHLHEPDRLHSPRSNLNYFLPEEGWIWFPKVDD